MQCQICLTHQRPGETFCTCGSMSQGTAEEVKKQTEQRINMWLIMSVLEFTSWRGRVLNRGRRYVNSAESQKLRKAIDKLDSTKKHIYGTIVEREQYQMRTHEQRYTQSDMEEYDRISNDKRIYVASSKERACYRDQYKVVQPHQRGGSNTAKTEAHLKHKQFVQWKSKQDQTILSTRCWTVDIVVFMDMVAFIKVFIVGLFVITNMATITITYHIWCPSGHKEEHKLRATGGCDTNQKA